MARNFRILNIFTLPDQDYSGNPLCVFEDGRGLSEDDMLALAGQMGMETIVLVPEAGKDGSTLARFFQPHRETGFAGSASIGAAYVLRQLGGDAVEGTRGGITVHRRAEDITVWHDQDDLWWIDGRPSTVRPINTETRFLAGLVGRKIGSLGSPVMAVKGSREAVVIPLKTVQDVHDANLDARLLHQYALLLNTEPTVYVFAKSDDHTIEGRMFYGPSGGVLEVPATASGTGNLGTYLATNGDSGVRYTVNQGSEVGRPSVMELTIGQDGKVSVGGRVRQVATGVVGS